MRLSCPLPSDKRFWVLVPLDTIQIYQVARNPHPSFLSESAYHSPYLIIFLSQTKSCIIASRLGCICATCWLVSYRKNIHVIKVTQCFYDSPYSLTSGDIIFNDVFLFHWFPLRRIRNLFLDIVLPARSSVRLIPRYVNDSKHGRMSTPVSCVFYESCK
jgi:hypothetical protein